MSTNNLALGQGTLETAVLSIIDSVNKKGVLPNLLEYFIEHRSDFAKERYTDSVRTAMIDYLLDRGFRVKDPAKIDEDFDAGRYDEEFSLAFEHALSVANGEQDPIDSAWRRPGSSNVGQWDFTVDDFSEIEEQGIVADNILAAGALDYIYELGEGLGVFRLVDALVLNWSAGSIDVVDGEAASRLYRYWKLRDSRATEAERGMVYRRVLNKGNGEVLSRMVVNESFAGLWRNLMAEVADYIDKTERVDSGVGEDSPVSRSRIYQATRDLQYNLTEYCNGMAHVQVREFYAQLQECFEILKDPEIIAYFGGNRRKTLWTVIEKLSKEEFGASPNIAAQRSIAVNGNKVFQWIANFNESGVRQEAFEQFLFATEDYILNVTKAIDEHDGWAGDEHAESEFEFDDADSSDF